MWKRWKKMKKRNNILDQITFRAFRKKDFPEILKLWQLCGMGGEERGDTAETILKCNSHGGYFVVLECTSQKIIIGTSWMTWDGRRIYLHHFCIHPEYRGKGFGKLLGHECLRAHTRQKTPCREEPERACPDRRMVSGREPDGAI